MELHWSTFGEKGKATSYDLPDVPWPTIVTEAVVYHVQINFKYNIYKYRYIYNIFWCNFNTFSKL